MAAPHSPSDFAPDITEQKRRARQHGMAARAGCDPALGAGLGEHVLARCPPPAGAVVAGFWPLTGEIDIRPLLATLAARGHVVGLPVTPRRGQGLTFRRWHAAEPLAPGRFGTAHPTGPEIVPDYLLVPLLAFDRHGNRLGYGAGYYDRTLASLPGAVTIGCAFAAQEVAEVPTEPTDVPLAAIATERGVIIIGG